MEVCCIKGCEKKVLALGMCVNHWRMNRKYGSPVAARPLSARMRGLSVEVRFSHQVEKTDGCWNWISCVDKDGYGRFRGAVAGKTYNHAHRFSFAFHTGQILASRDVVMHKCDNPKCVNPDHLTVGTYADNTKDMISKKRDNRIEQARSLSRFSDADILAILQDERPYFVIAKHYGVSAPTIGDIKARKTHRYVDASGIEVSKKTRGTHERLVQEI